MITVLIDSPPTARYHRATIAALRHAVEQTGNVPGDATSDRASAFSIEVVRTDEVVELGNGVVIGPGTPYNDPGAADDVITTARERGVPLVAT